MKTYAVWMQIPNEPQKTPWSNIARGVTAEEADVYRRTCFFPIHVEEEVRP
ncbi:hypothetical protein HUO13_11915 [Saccharopolyspora erythraea]|uniref:hypothetical protein n=1 Tax=Saccharopolyspora erythraea TaxID=1836 RepID=UPI001BACBA5F|nr:hypothetical protein [Saccharopolyspora erythraea]QUH01421.1 hypothetical protein HUO13_11915 [Saccharopolyspora erythraea]